MRKLLSGLLLSGTLLQVNTAESGSLSSTPSDSTLYRLDEVIVSASRTEMLVSESPVAAEVISGARLLERNAYRLSDALNGSTDIFIKDYGGSNIKTVTLRGMNAEHTVFMVNGVRLSSMQIGVVDCGDIPVEMIERIEVIRSGNSAIVGADAVAGSVNIVFPYGQEKPSISLYTAIGSFGTSKSGVSIRQTVGPVSITGGAFMERSTGNFPYTLSRQTEQISRYRDNNDYTRKNLILSLSTKLGTSSSMGALLWYGGSGRGIPGQILSESDRDGVARQNDRTLRLFLSSGFPIAGTIRCRVTADIQQLYQRYEDPLYPYGNGPLDTYSSNTIHGGTAEFNVPVSGKSMFVFGAEIRRYSLEGNELTTMPNRTQQSFYSIYDLRWQELGDVVESIYVLPALRYDRFSDIGSRTSPKLAVSLRSVPITGWGLRNATVTLRGNVGTNYRVPTFNDLYYPWSGNPQLKPENSTSGEAGVLFKNDFSLYHMVEITWFSIRTIDRILWAPGEGGLWFPQNIGKSLSTGFEFSFTLRTPDEIFSLNGNYTTLKTTKENSDGENDQTYKKQLPFVPREIGKVAIQCNPYTPVSWLPKVWLGLEWRHTGLRYATAENNPDEVLPSYNEAGLICGADVLVGFFSARLVVSIQNLFNKSYEVMSGYPVPRRSYMVSCTVQL
jgi:outer membrane cobalamin receptor